MKDQSRRPHKSVLELRRFHDEWIGTYFAIHIDGGFAYGRLIRNGNLACYDLKSTAVLSVSEVKRAPVLFIVFVSRYDLVDGRWQVIGKEPLEPEFDQPVRYYREDPFTGIVDIYVEGRFEPYLGEDLSKMECASVWRAHHVEARLDKELFGRADRYRDRKVPQHPWGRPTA